MSRNRGGSRHLTDLLGPLRRFLWARVGRSWDDVMSEVHTRIQPGSHLQQHLLEHLQEMVEVHPPRERHLHRQPALFAHPQTGRLCRR